MGIKQIQVQPIKSPVNKATLCVCVWDVSNPTVMRFLFLFFYGRSPLLYCCILSTNYRCHQNITSTIWISKMLLFLCPPPRYNSWCPYKLAWEDPSVSVAAFWEVLVSFLFPHLHFQLSLIQSCQHPTTHSSFFSRFQLVYICSSSGIYLTGLS